MGMFCYQCQEAAKGVGCQIKGVCGKEPQTSALMDLLLYISRGVAIIQVELRKNDLASKETDFYILDALFSTITNANFDDTAIANRITEGLAIKRAMLQVAKEANIDIPVCEEVNFEVQPADYLSVATTLGILNETDEDLRSLKQLIIYGVKGAAAYADHALNLGYSDDSIFEMIENALAQASRKDIDVPELIDEVMRVGECGIQAMALLDMANTESYGHPEISEVKLDAGSRPGILVSGHDLKDLEELLEQTKDAGIDIYTHSEMLPAHYYPKFKKYEHFYGNYGNSWWRQREEFSSFNGPILFTTNCIVPPLDGANYTDRIYTTGSAGLPGAVHIGNRKDGEQKDFSQLIAHAKTCVAPEAIESGSLVGGFAHNQVIALADKVIEAIQQGAIKRFVVMAGCDGRMNSRAYYSDFATALPQDSVILTAGCAKYRYNKLPLGNINGIPRVLDAGQCNDSYSLVMIALALKDALGLEDVNQLPIIYNIAWYEQKAVIVLLALLKLGVKNIHLGPTLPAFLSPNVRDVLVENFGISGTTDVAQDMNAWIA